MTWNLNLSMTLLNKISIISRRKKREEVLGRNTLIVHLLEIMILSKIHSAKGRLIKIRSERNLILRICLLIMMMIIIELVSII